MMKFEDVKKRRDLGVVHILLHDATLQQIHGSIYARFK